LNSNYHSIPRSAFDALAAGGGGPDAIRDLARARYSKHVTMLAGVVSQAEDAGHRQQRLARRGFSLLAEVKRQHPAVADQVIMHPSVGAWALRAMGPSQERTELAGADPGWLSAIAAAAAIRAGVAAEIEVEAVDGAVMLPSLGRARVYGDAAVARSGQPHAEVFSAQGRVTIPADVHSDAPGWQGLRRVRVGALDVIIDDLDSFRMPSSTDLAPRLSPAAMTRFGDALRQAWPLLASDHSDVAAEVLQAVTVVVPLVSVPGGHISSSSSATFGAVALSEPPDPYTCAETFAHEMQHLKLSALLDVVALTLPDDGRRYYAPWRDDPRPVGGLLQGAYAFLGVSGFWRRQCRLAPGKVRLRAETEFLRWREAARRVVSTLQSSGHLTATGLDFVNGMAKTLDTWREEHVSPEAESLARRRAAKHLADWEAANGPVPDGERG
jgi:HEXXH motif-containing protein